MPKIMIDLYFFTTKEARNACDMLGIDRRRVNTRFYAHETLDFSDPENPVRRKVKAKVTVSERNYEKAASSYVADPAELEAMREEWAEADAKEEEEEWELGQPIDRDVFEHKLNACDDESRW